MLLVGLDKNQFGSFSIPVTNLSILPRVTLPLLPPVMNIKVSVLKSFHKFRKHQIKSALVLAI